MPDTNVNEKINNAVMDVLLDTNAENKKHIERLDNALKRSYLAIIFVVCLLFASFIYYEHNMRNLIKDFDFGATATFDIDSENNSHTTNNGNINVGK